MTTIKSILLSFTLLLLIMSPSYVDAQTKDMAELTDYADEKFGTNDFIINGWKYYPEHFNAKGNPYFENMEWTRGSITTTAGEQFDNLQLRYNVQMDEIVLKQPLKDGFPAFILLNKDFVFSFTINGRKFQQAEKSFSGGQLQGFVEVVYSGKNSFVSKHQKNFIGNYTASTPQGSISKQTTINYLVFDAWLEKVQTKKAFLKTFQTHRKQIKKYMNTHNIHYKKATAFQLNNLMQFCDEL